MDEKVKEIAKEFINSEVDFRRFIRDLQSQIAHEAMIKANGNMSKAVKLLGGIQRETMSIYLGMRSNTWNKKYNPNGNLDN